LKFKYPFSISNAIGFCLLSFSIILAPTFLSKILFNIQFPVQFAIWLNIPAFLIPSLFILNKNNIYLYQLFTSHKINSISFWILSIITSFGFFIILGEIENYVLYYFPISDDLLKLMKTLLSSSLGVLAAVIMAPITEEIFFRGALLNNLNVKYSPLSSIFFSAFLFGFIHLNPWQFLPVFLGGLFFGYLYYISKNIWLCIFLHFFNNGLAILLETSGLKLKGITYDPRVGIEFQPLWLTIIGLVIFIYGINKIYYKFN